MIVISTYIQRMYNRWRFTSAIEAAFRQLKPYYLTPMSSYLMGFRSMTYIQQMYARWQYESERARFFDTSLGGPIVDYDKPTVEELKLTGLSAMFGYIPQPPSEPEIICPCCKGSGTYTGFHVVEPCQECKGTGKVKGSKPADQPGAKGSPDVDYGALGL
jgi:hypothetical protein